MLLTNINPKQQLANGTRGTITQIILRNEHDSPLLDSPCVSLQEPPAYVIMRLDGDAGFHLPGLEANEVLIEPIERKMCVRLDNKSTCTITRLQLPLEAAYSFTDIRSQGQTIQHVVVDISKPPTGPNITPFNAYVAISRGRGRQTIRLLRNFQDSLFTTPPSNDLLREDVRLGTLDLATPNAVCKPINSIEATY
jgi:hypothetical protein